MDSYKSNYNLDEGTFDVVYGTLMTGDQPYIQNLGGLVSVRGVIIAPTAWPFVNTLNQNLGTSNSPTFVSVTSNLIGNVTGNCSGSSSTVTNATQTSITTLPNLSSVQGQTLAASVWPFVSTLNQNVGTSNSPTFVTVTANLTGNVTGNLTGHVVGNVLGTFVGKASEIQPAITTLPNLTSIQSQTLAATVWPFVSTLNQNVGTTSSPSFVTVTANLSGNVTGNCSGSSATVTNATQSSITALPNLTSVQGWNIPWQFLAYLDQNLQIGSSPTFNTVTANLVGTCIGNCTGTCDTVTNTSQAAILSLPNVTTIRGTNIPSTCWPFVALMDQQVRFNSSPTFATLTTANIYNNNYVYTANMQASNLIDVTGVANLRNFTRIYNSTLDFPLSIRQPDLDSSGKVIGDFTNYGAFCISSTSNNDKRLAFAVDSTSNFSIIQSIWAGNSTRALKLNPSGGDIFFNGGITASNQTALYINTTTGLISRATSSRKCKERIEENRLDTSSIYRLKVKEFDYKEENGGGHDIGFIAEEIDEIPELRYLLNYDSEQKPESVKYDKVAVYLLEEMKKLAQRIKLLERQIANKDNNNQQNVNKRKTMSLSQP